MTFTRPTGLTRKLNFSHLLAALALFALFNCNKRGGGQEEIGDPDTTRITGRNVRKVLAAYGKKHPETLVILSTPFGDMKAQLYEQTPLHRANFIRLAKGGFWDTASFHRVIKDFMVQAGYSDKRKLILEDYLVPYENDPMRFHKKGALGMAHHDAAPGSSPFDFYIVDGTVLTRDSLNNFSSATGASCSPTTCKPTPPSAGRPTSTAPIPCSAKWSKASTSSTASPTSPPTSKPKNPYAGYRCR
jgi:peptidyl-prolyl cis-trans isomerase B (cyclophilin B)